MGRHSRWMSTPRRLTKVASLVSAERRVLTKAQLDSAGVTRAERRQHLSQERWRALGDGAVAVDHGPLIGQSACRRPWSVWQARPAWVASPRCKQLG